MKSYNSNRFCYQKTHPAPIVLFLICNLFFYTYLYSNNTDGKANSNTGEFTVGASITLESSDLFYINDDISPEKRGQYALYKIKNTGTTIDAYVRISNFTGDIRLGDAENDVYYIGQLAPNETGYTYLYLVTDLTIPGQNGSASGINSHTISVYDGDPDDSGIFIDSENFEINLIEDVIKASANKVTGVTLNGTPTLGEVFSITVNGETGTIGAAKIVSFSAATNINWPAKSFKLKQVFVEFTKIGNGNNNNDGLSFENDLNFEVMDTKNTAYEITYTFMVISSTNAVSEYEPTAYISSGTQFKHSILNNGVEVPKIPASGSTLSGFVWSDDNFDGIKQNGESKMNGAKVRLLDTLGNQLESTTSSGMTGEFEFTGILSGNYQIRFDRNDRFVATKQNATTADSLDSDINRATRMVALTVTSGINIPNITAGFSPDFDRDLIPDAIENAGSTSYDAVDPAGYLYDELTGEAILGGQIQVTGPGNINIVDSGSATGYYSWLIDGTPGIYTMTIIPPGGYNLSTTRNALPTLDPTGLTPDPYLVGSRDNDNNGYLDDYSAGVNPYYLSFELASGDPFIINNNIPFSAIILPVKISSFTGTAKDCLVELKWVTESEENFSHFELERSEDAVNFRMIASQPNRSTFKSQFANHYHYTHTDRVTSPSNYYRLKMIDIDGSYEYSEIIEVKADCGIFDQIVSVYPNPVGPYQHELTISISSKISRNLDFKIINTQGILIKKQTTFLQPGITQINLDISELVGGVYFIAFNDQNGVRKFIKFVSNRE